MQVTSPLPVPLVALTLALPGVYLAGRSLARWMDGNRTTSAVLTPAAAISLWLLAIHLVARATSSFLQGLVAGTLLVSAGGHVAAWRRRRAGEDERRDGQEPPRIPAIAWLGAASVMALLAPTALGWAIHDENLLIGHMSIPAMLHNDVYPPREINFPSIELGYHYGFDLLTAVVAALTRLPIPLAIDVITIVSFGYSFILLWSLGERVVGPSRGALTALVTLFGGGAAFLVAGAAPSSGASLVRLYAVDGVTLNPPLTCYFFQHPWTLGLPIALAALLAAGDRDSRAAPRYAVLGVLLVALSLAQIVLFLTVSGSLLAQEAFARGRLGSPRLLRAIRGARLDVVGAGAMVLTLLLVLAGARGLGGFFQRADNNDASRLLFHLGITNTLKGSVRWLLLTYGLLLPLGLAGVAFLRRGRLLFAALFVGSVAVVNVARHSHTPDIAKFATVGAIALGVLSSASLARLAAVRFIPLRVVAFCLGLAGATVTGLAFPLMLGFAPEKVPAAGLWPRSVAEPSPSDVKVIAWLRRHVELPDVIYREREASYAYAMWGGIPIAWLHIHADIFGATAPQIRQRRALLAAPPKAAEPYLAQGIRWFILSPRDAPLTAYADQWIAEGRAAERATFDDLRIVELLRAPSPSAP